MSDIPTDAELASTEAMAAAMTVRNISTMNPYTIRSFVDRAETIIAACRELRRELAELRAKVANGGV